MWTSNSGPTWDWGERSTGPIPRLWAGILLKSVIHFDNRLLFLFIYDYDTETDRLKGTSHNPTYLLHRELHVCVC